MEVGGWGIRDPGFSILHPPTSILKEFTRRPYDLFDLPQRGAAIESEGIQVGLPQEFLHEMWTLCNEARAQVADQVWLHSNISGRPSSKARIRDLTYQALIQFLESNLQ